jgi:hypothetical protein
LEQLADHPRLNDISRAFNNERPVRHGRT